MVSPKNKKILVFVFLASVFVVELRIILNLYEEILYQVSRHEYYIPGDGGKVPYEVVEQVIERVKMEVLSIEEISTLFLCMNDQYGFKLIPNCSTLFEGDVKLPVTEIHINSDGYRDKLYFKEKPNNTYRIIVLGDSFAFGWGLNISDVFSEVLEELLNKDLKSIENGMIYEVINLAVPGSDTSNEHHMLEETGVYYEPDLVIISFVPNDEEDANRIEEIIAYCEDKRDILKNDILYGMTEEQIEFFCVRYGAEIYHEELIRINPETRWMRIEEPLIWIDNLSLKNDFDVLVFFWYDNDYQEGKLRDFCEAHYWHFLDSKELNVSTIHKFDGHPSLQYHREVGERIYSYLIEVLI